MKKKGGLIGSTVASDFALNDRNSVNWLADKIVKPKVKTVDKRKVVHGILWEASNIVNDPMWKNMLLSASIGKFPKKVSLKNDKLTYRKAGKTKPSVPFTFTDPKKAADVFIQFIKDNSGLRSDMDKKNRGKPKSTIYNNWKDIRSSTIKRNLIDAFVVNIVKSLKLSSYTVNRLSHIIHHGFMMGQFTKTSVMMKKGKVVSIKGLMLDKETEYFYIDPDINALKEVLQ